MKHKLGEGGMGAVFQARQVSLDRDVAIKVLPADLAARPDFLARFTREALSAARLNHHNIVQIYDVLNADNIHFFSMEYVRGRSLGDVIRGEGKLDIETSAGYVLQACRGLLYAHKRGVIHRDIKPDNLMLNEHGVVKIADMGLAKIQGQSEREHGQGPAAANKSIHEEALPNLTNVGAAMGTPAYMAPEQGRDASRVDHRADQYSLGCTLYYLCAGKTPYTGRTTFEIISKHATEPLVPLDTHVKNVPEQLTVIIEKMLAKSVEDRYPSLAEAIRDLEAYLGVETEKGTYTPREEHMGLLEAQEKAYYDVPSLKKRKLAVTGFFAITTVLFFICFFALGFVSAGAVLGILILTPLSNFIIDGVRNKRFLFRRVRSVFFGMGWRGWANMLMWFVLTAMVLFWTNLLVAWILVAFVAVGLAVAYQSMIVRKVEQERSGHLIHVREMLKVLRIRGVSEEALQDFVCRFSHENWEEFFEDLFGYESMIIHRERWASRDKVTPRKRYNVWRDPIARWLDEVEERRRTRREEAQIAKAEKARLKAEGKTESEAEKEADKLAKDAVNDGLLLNETVIIEAKEGTTPSKEEVAKAWESPTAKNEKRGHGLIFWCFRLTRFVLGLLMIGVWLIGALPNFGVDLPVPGFINSFVTGTYASWGLGDSLLAPVAGFLLLLTVFSGRVILPALVTIGCLVMLFINPVVAIVGQPNFTARQAEIGSIAAVLFGFIGMVFGIFGGKKR